MRVYKLELIQPLDMAGAGGEQDNGWFEHYGVQVVDDHILLCATKGPIVHFLLGYDESYDPNDTGYEIEEINYEPKPLKRLGEQRLTDEERDRMTNEIRDDYTSLTHGDGMCQDQAEAELDEMDDTEFLDLYKTITTED